ncbi:MAG: dihydroneopterin aldolase [Helicobacteraceae bacterium]|nr:dihydroneopterin aldolase [Helicobacteraceae bacterium]
MNDLFKISLKDFKISTKIGILPNEKQNAQDLIINLDVVYKKSSVLDYAEIYEIIKATFRNNHFDYLEDCIDFLIDLLYKKFSNIEQINLSISKLQILPNCIASVSKCVSKGKYND